MDPAAADADADATDGARDCFEVEEVEVVEVTFNAAWLLSWKDGNGAASCWYDKKDSRTLLLSSEYRGCFLCKLTLLNKKSCAASSKMVKK
jgi:hypothetical protein